MLGAIVAIITAHARQLTPTYATNFKHVPESIRSNTSEEMKVRTEDGRIDFCPSNLSNGYI